MRTYPLDEARVEFSKGVERALAGEPQRVTRYGKEAVIIVSEADWLRGPKSAGTLGDLLADYAELPSADETFFERPALPQIGTLGSDFDDA
jgi:prevent-host-death family protein